MTASDLIRRSTAATLGLTDADLRRQTAARELLRVRRGSYVDHGEFTGFEASQRHLTAIAAAYADQDRLRAVSFQSALVAHGLPVWAIDLSRVHVTKERRNAGRIAGDLHVHTNHIEDDEVVDVTGMPVTSAARTVFDVSCVVPFEQGVVVADAALNCRLTTPQKLAETIERWPKRRGLHRARLVVAFADGRSESVGESRSRVGMHRHGIPVPELQHSVYDDDGELLGISDFRWGRLLGEFDGMVKYGRLLRPGQTAADTVISEKIREDRMRAQDHGMFRWIWADLATEMLWRRLAAAVDRHA